MNNKKIREIIKFNIQKNIQNKWFIIFNIITLIVMIFSMNTENIKNFLESKNINIFDENISIEILDKDNLATNGLKEAFNKENFEIKEVEENLYTKENIPDDLVLIQVDKSEENFVEAKVISKDSIDSYIYEEIDSVLTKVRSDLFSEKNEIEKQELEKLNEPVKIEKIFLSVDAENSETKELIKTISTFAIYMISIFIFSKIANEIAQEKVSKSIEYVLTSVTEKEYLLSKIVSIIGVTLLQGIYFIIYYFIGNLINNIINIAELQNVTTDFNVLITGIDKDIIIYMITVLGYGILTLILMSIIQAAISSKTTSMDEAGNTIGLLTTITIFAYFITLFVITPYTKMNTFLYILSCIPLLSNYFIPAVLVIGQATPLQVIVSLFLLIISIPIAFNICAKIFKNGVLDYKTTKNKKTRKNKNELTFEEKQNLELTKKKYKKIGFILGMALIIYLSTSIIFNLISTVIITSMLTDVMNMEQIELLNLALNSILSLGLAALLVFLYEEKEKVGNSVTVKEKIKIILEGIFFIGIIQILNSYLYEKIGIDYNVVDMISIENNKNILTNILLFICLAVVPAVFEELLFRKAIIDVTRRVNIEFAIISSSLIFGLIHMNLGQTIFAFVLGLIFAWIYIKTNDIKITMILHLLNNGYATLQMLIFSENFWNILNVVTIGIMIVGFISFIYRIFGMLKNKELKVKIHKEEIKNYKYIFTEYTFVLSLIILVIMFTYTENILRLGL